ncbi:MAG: hypothetical protein J5674_06375 [Candidatus Methanomethylophilaceae archaeon]|nr:hypothetical protein [Candidatus Methanomethylophilaceae archaeon]
MRLIPTESEDMCPEITRFTLFFLASSICSSGKCMPTTVPTPASASFSYICFGPEVPPVILHRTLPHLLSLDPTTILGGELHLAASLNSGSLYRTSIMSPSL